MFHVVLAVCLLSFPCMFACGGVKVARDYLRTNVMKIRVCRPTLTNPGSPCARRFHAFPRAKMLSTAERRQNSSQSFTSHFLFALCSERTCRSVTSVDFFSSFFTFSSRVFHLPVNFTALRLFLHAEQMEIIIGFFIYLFIFTCHELLLEGDMVA